MKVKSIFGLIVAVAFLWSAVCAIKPFWDKYWLGEDVKAAATYGTKHTIAETRKYLTEIMEENNRGFIGEDFYIEKDENNSVTISIIYDDEIRIFGMTITEVELTVEKTRSEVKTRF